MALIRCPECYTRQMSEHAKSCPGCGYELAPGEGASIRKAEEKERERLDKIEAEREAERDRKENIQGCIVATICIIIMALIIWGFYALYKSQYG